MPTQQYSTELTSLRNEWIHSFERKLIQHIGKRTLTEDEAQQILTQLQHIITISQENDLKNINYIRLIFYQVINDVLMRTRKPGEPSRLLPAPDILPLPKPQVLRKYHSERKMIKLLPLKKGLFVQNLN